MGKSELVHNIVSQGIEIYEQQVDFDIINLQQAGIAIFKEQSYYRLVDKIILDKRTLYFLNFRILQCNLLKYVIIDFFFII
jgi:hypothetical protein